METTTPIKPDLKLMGLTHQMMRQIDMRRASKELTKSKMKVLGALIEKGKPCTRREISKMNGYNIGCVESGMMREMSEDGLVRRRAIEVKRKNYNLVLEYSLTGKGVETMDYILTGKESK
jgi:chromosome segregation and condensation protein ScpB